MASVDEQSSQVRRIAILVTSLDATAGRQLLMAMPAELARNVRRAMTRLGNVDPEEQREIMAEFRMRALTSAPEPANHSNESSNVSRHSREHDAALQSSDDEEADAVRMEQTAAAFARPAGAAPHAASAWSGSQTIHASQHEASHTDAPAHHAPQRPWQRLDVDSLTNLLRGERATVVAVVLSQLDPKQAAQVLQQLPRTEHRNVITALTRLGQIDPDAMAAIDDHLAVRIADYHHRKTEETEVVGRMQQLLSAASPEFQSNWQSIIQQSNVQLAHRMGISSGISSAVSTGLNRCLIWCFIALASHQRQRLIIANELGDPKPGRRSEQSKRRS